MANLYRQIAPTSIFKTSMGKREIAAKPSPHDVDIFRDPRSVLEN